MLGKTSVAAGASPLFDGLAKATGERPEWNFHKYLVARDGTVVAQYSSLTAPDDRAFVAAIENLLAR
jgi:glutathione peroxidase